MVMAEEFVGPNPGVVNVAQELAKRIREAGSLDMDDARDWIETNYPELGSQKAALVLGYGSARGRYLWKEEGGMLVPDAKPEKPARGRRGDTAPREEREPLLSDDDSLNEPREQFFRMGVRVGVPREQAQVFANYIDQAYDLGDPASVLAGFRKCPELRPPQRARWWESWCSANQLPVTDELKRAARMSNIEAEGLVSQGARSDQPIAARPRLYVAVEGEVIRTAYDDEDGMPFAEARQLAALQRQHIREDREPPPPPQDNTLLAAMISSQGELFKAIATRPPDTSAQEIARAQQDAMLARMEAQSQQFIQLMQSQQETTKLMFEMLQERHDHQMERLTEAIESVSQRRSPFQEMDEMLPGVGTKFLERLLNPPAPSSGPVIKLEGGEMSLDTYLQLENMNMKKQTLGMAREMLPDFIAAAQRLTEGTDRLAAERGDSIPGAAPGEEYEEDTPAPFRKSNCVVCGIGVTFHPGSEAFRCPLCQTFQQVDGVVLEVGERAKQMMGDSESEPAPMPEPEVVEGSEPLEVEVAEMPRVEGAEEEQRQMQAEALQTATAVAFQQAPDRPPDESEPDYYEDVLPNSSPDQDAVYAEEGL